ncbi:ATP-binding protein involved in chromosome partitioning [Alteromonadaceae bacterium 2753L.S.0a.02]|nr:ATP-binding protein involved in chromosome partitioning [Alteromonadaceae bacterium 2753L.S.0a.02]
MNSDLLQQLDTKLGATEVPGISGIVLGDITETVTAGNSLRLHVALGARSPMLQAQLKHDLAQILTQLGVSADVDFSISVPEAKPSPEAKTGNLAQVKNIVAVASGKGGVGKSTTAVNLALALAADGASVGMLDADIYGPSQPHMLGVGSERPVINSPSSVEPIEVHGLKLISMGSLVTEKTPMVWRGPMASSALQQLMHNTNWGELDYLIVDMPPGTGDIQLTLSQSVALSGAVIVTTPQDIALLDAKKGVEMFTKVDVPVLGVVENMSTHICSNCGHTEAIFGEEGGERLAEQYGVSLLGRLPLTMAIRAQTDSGLPPVAAEPASNVAAEYFSIARKLAASIWQLSLAGNTGPLISITDD